MTSKKKLRDIDNALAAESKKVHIEISREYEFANSLSLCDHAINDILHHIELSQLTDKELLRDARYLRKKLKERRYYKDKLELIKASQLCNVEVLKKCINNQENRKYGPKVLKGLKFRR